MLQVMRFSGVFHKLKALSKKKSQMVSLVSDSYNQKMERICSGLVANLS